MQICFQAVARLIKKFSKKIGSNGVGHIIQEIVDWIYGGGGGIYSRVDFIPSISMGFSLLSTPLLLCHIIYGEEKFRG